MAETKVVATVNVSIPKDNGSSFRISGNFGLSNLDRATGWGKDQRVSIKWSSPTFSSRSLRIKNDKRAAIDTDWKKNTQDNVVFATGTLDSFDSKTKVYFATMDREPVSSNLQGPVSIIVSKV